MSLYLALPRPARGTSISDDEIDRVLAAHYGFTDEELDFTVNYDIKYRMGQENGDGEGNGNGNGDGDNEE